MGDVKKLIVSAAIVAPAFFLGACATNFDVDGVSAMPDKGNAFASALHKRYIERAKFEVGEEDWMSVDYFTSHAEMAANGEVPAPQDPADRRLKTDADLITAAHNQLTAALATNAPKTAPDACARAQTWLEHWMEQAEEGHQPDHIAWTRGEYEKAIPECVGKPMAKPAPMKNPGPFVIYFDFNSAALTGEAQATIKDIVAASKDFGPQYVYVRGHTDTSGSSAYNAKLAEKRAKAVAAALQKMGVTTNIVSSDFGEDKPQVATGDNVREKMNRRVEVSFGK